MSRRDHRVVAVLLLGWLSVGCGRSDPPTPRPPPPAPAVAPIPPHAPDPIANEWYRAVVGSGLDEVPFFLSMPPPATAGGCSIVNGDEHIDVECSWTDDAAVLNFPVFATSIHATRDAAGALTGTWQMSRLTGVLTPVRFAATRIARPDPMLRFPDETASGAGTAPGDFSGIWKFRFAALEAGKGILKQTQNGIVTGTIIPQTIGDMRYLAGNARGNTLLLSTFDGQHAYVVHAALDPKREALQGTWTFSQVLTDKFTARRVPGLDIALVETLRLRAGTKGVTIPQLDDPRYRGKPVIVDYFGTWCPACVDETPYLLELYRRHHAEGLEILSIALEGTTDDAYNRRQVEYFRKRYAIPWQIVTVSGDYSDSEKLLPPELTGTGGYPVTIFLERNRHVRGMHSGFFGPAAGDDLSTPEGRLRTIRGGDARAPSVTRSIPRIASRTGAVASANTDRMGASG